MMKSITILLLILLTISCARSSRIKNGSQQATPKGHSIRVSLRDVEIIQRASDILSKPIKWDQRDDRKCPDFKKTYSIYCAVYHASLEIIGEFDHRSGAMEELRRTVEEFSQGKKYEHRLMDFNNDPSTKFSDIQRVLTETQTRLQKRLDAIR